MLSTRKSRLLFIGLITSLLLIALLCAGLWAFAHRPLTTLLANLPKPGGTVFPDASMPAESLTPLP